MRRFKWTPSRFSAHEDVRVSMRTFIVLFPSPITGVSRKLLLPSGVPVLNLKAVYIANPIFRKIDVLCIGELERHIHRINDSVLSPIDSITSRLSNRPFPLSYVGRFILTASMPFLLMTMRNSLSYPAFFRKAPLQPVHCFF